MPNDLTGVPMSRFSRGLVRRIRRNAWLEGAMAATNDPADLPENPYEEAHDDE